tara:strand:- start:2134 stop:3096 length:963 start_codon:yes stop_codon:yes gene_type:complete
MIDGNTSNETANTELSMDDAVKLMAQQTDSNAAPVELESETSEAPEMEATEATEPDEYVEENEEGDDVEYEAAAETEVEEDIFVEINGENISLEDVGKGYLRQADYTKKTQEMAASRKAMSDLQASIAAEREHLQQVLAMSTKVENDAPDWVQLATDDPLEYTRQRAIFDANESQRSAQNAESERLATIRQQEQQEQLQTFVAEQGQKLNEQIPELAGDKASDYKAGITKYMQNVGYSAEELGRLFDHRAVILADKARKYDALMAKGTEVKQKVKGKPKVLRPGRKQSKALVKDKARNQQMAQLRNSGSIDDAVALLRGR